jgi:hypothetical protein
MGNNMTPQTNFVSLNAVLKQAVALGASATYETFKECVFQDSAMRASITVVASGPKRNVYFVPQDIGAEFAKRYAAAHARRVPVAHQQRELGLQSQETVDLSEKVADLVEQLDAIRLAVIAIGTKVDKLSAMWECLGDDQK